MEPKPLVQKKKSFSVGDQTKRSPWVLLFAFILALLFGIFLLRVFFSTSEKKFDIEKKADGNLLFYGLEKEEIQKQIDWGEEVLWAPYTDKSIQIRFLGKESNWFRKILIGKPPVFYAHAVDLTKGTELRDKEIEFVGCEGIKDKKIVKTQQTFKNLFKKKSRWTFENVIWAIVMILSALAGLIFLENYLGVNIISWLFSPFTSLQKNEGEVNIPKIGFKEVGGLTEAKEELGEVVAYFRQPNLFWQRGAKVPKGVLLVGPPGNGKTLLAKALAGECGLPFLFRSGSEFEEMMVGVGARRVRSLFHKARSYPQGCIIFIDEIDSIGKKRYSAHTSYTEQTLNQLLSELDGFQPRTNIIILAATNSLKVLDSALLRPGRFDRQIYIPLPNLKGRKEIIALCTRKMALSPQFDLAEIASLTRGFSGAQITNLFNEASILSIRYQRNFVDQEIILEAYDRVLMGPSLTSETVTPKRKRITAYHEAGHAVIGMTLPETTVRKITIIPRLGVGGYTWIPLQEEEGDHNLPTKKQMLAHVMSFLGGRASEELIFGVENVTIGAWSDFKSASEIVRELILYYGMSDLGVIPTRESFFSEWEVPSELPETTKQKIEHEREKIMNQCWKRVRQILIQKRKILDLLAVALLTKSTLQKEEISYIFYTQTLPNTLLLTK
ncbi:MAG: AAA family ATPase [Candidatus Moeniiplasma glomeromycotorum]|nr:AAA family ATPase [Candidatus Moeniiplasma glomeromycotorum]MCE8168075.1 AAA family ATPase [Candidatus Moeniiplasma glomeromycotorum]MCE8169616.1 AAA family ATPase [Candidatus Moeniiplasma glomeromycotorum]